MKRIIVFILLFTESIIAQDVSLNIDQLMWLGKLPQKTPSNLLVDNLDYLLSQNKDSSKKIGYLNFKGERIIYPVYDMGLDFYCSYANISKDSIHGIIDKKGNVTYFPQYDKVFFYNDSVGIARKNKKSALIDKIGNKITEFAYSRIDTYGFDFFRAFIDKENSFIINDQGKRIFKLNPKIKSLFLIDSILVYEDSVNGKQKQGLVNLKGKKILPAKYDKLSSHFDNDGLMLVTDNGKQGYINRNGNIVIPIVYDKLSFGFTEGLLAASKKGKWGFIDKQENVIIPFIYDETNGFSEGLAFVKKGKYYGYIDKQNHVRIPFKFENTKFSFFVQSRAIFKDTVKGKFGFINKKGKIIVKPIYDMALPFYNNKAFVRLNKKEGFVNRKGKPVIPIKYKQLWMERNGMIRFVE